MENENRPPKPPRDDSLLPVATTGDGPALAGVKDEALQQTTVAKRSRGRLLMTWNRFLFGSKSEPFYFEIWGTKLSRYLFAQQLAGDDVVVVCRSLELPKTPAKPAAPLQTWDLTACTLGGLNEKSFSLLDPGFFRFRDKKYEVCTQTRR